MMLFSVILLLALNIRPSEMAHPLETQRGAARPVVTLTPNWGNILTGESVTLTCHVTSAAPEEPPYHWYRDNQTIPGDQKRLVIDSSRMKDSGDYQCRSRTSDTSHPVTLRVINVHMILQTPPPPIYEGDPLTLRCHHRQEDYFTVISTKFYQDGEEIQSLGSELRIHNPTINSSGTYRCTKLIQDKRYNSDHEPSAESLITVRELFSRPTIIISPSRIIEGGEMRVTCDTRLEPLRPDTELQFAFYRDGRRVQNFTASDTYRVPTPQQEDSGNYSCEVRTSSGTVRRTSDPSHILIMSKAVYIAIITATTAGIVVVIIISAVILLRCKRRDSPPCGKRHQAITRTADPDPDQQDVCYTYLDIRSFNKVSEGNNAENDLNITYATVKKT